MHVLIQGGSQQLSQMMANDLADGAVMLETAVTAIEQVTPDRIVVRTTGTNETRQVQFSFD